MAKPNKLFFFDSEFIENGKTIELISIGIVAEDGREYYSISDEFNEFDANEWVIKNVISKLETNLPRKTKSQIRAEILSFVGKSSPLFVANHADYDWVLLCMLFGTMMDLPKSWKTWCYDVAQLRYDLGNPKVPEQESDLHNALADARQTKREYDFLMKLRAKKEKLFYAGEGAVAGSNG